MSELKGSGQWEVRDVDGVWHPCTGFQASAYRLAGAEVRRVTAPKQEEKPQ